jgi:hypothetical protein
MPMIDVYAATGTFADKHQLAVDLATAVMTIEQVPGLSVVDLGIGVVFAGRDVAEMSAA